MSSWTFN